MTRRFNNMKRSHHAPVKLHQRVVDAVAILIPVAILLVAGLALAGRKIGF